MCAASEGGIVIRRSNVVRASLLALATLTASNARAQPHFEQLRIIAPAAPGRRLGPDRARRCSRRCSAPGIVATPVVENVPGAAGTIGLARFIGAERGNGDVLLVSGLIMLGGIVTHRVAGHAGATSCRSRG